MATYVPPKKNTAFKYYTALKSAATPGAFQTNPTIATGDFKVSIDGGALNNLATLPTVTPAGGQAVEVNLSTSEMNGDCITVLAHDAAGSEWVDQFAIFHTVAHQLDDTYTAAADKTGVSLSSAGIDGILDEVVEGSYTFRQFLRLFASVLAGKTSGGGTASLTFRDTGDSKNRITATVDTSGNRVTISLDLT